MIIVLGAVHGHSHAGIAWRVGQVYVSAPEAFEQGRQYIGRDNAAPTAVAKPGEPASSAGIKAIDPETGKTMWDFKIFQSSLTNGVLATAGNVVFGAGRDGNLVALDARSGAHLWHFQTGANVNASPNQLRGRRSSVHRHRRRKRRVRVRATGIIATLAGPSSL